VLKKFDIFNNLNEDVLLAEALNNPKEYYMTDDTVLPSKMYGATTINGGTYIIRLVEQNGEGIYTLDVGKVKKVGGKAGWWKFHNPSDILPVIATTLDFAKKAITTVGPKLTGIAIRLHGQIGKRKVAERIAIKALKKSSMNIFTVFQVTQVGEKQFTKKYNHGYVFIGKKALSPEAIFKAKEFKEFGFDPSKKDNTGALLKSLDSMKPKKPVKQTHTIAPSKKYTFGQYDLDVPSDTETLDRLAAAKVSGEVAKHIEKQVEVEKKIDSSGVFDPEDMSSVGALANALRTTPEFAKMANALRVNGFDVKKVNFDNLQYVYNQMSTFNKQLVDTMAAGGSLPDANLGNIKGATGQIWIEILKYMAMPVDASDEKHMMAIIAYRNAKKEAAFDSIKTAVSKPSKVKKKGKLDVDMTEFKSTMPGTGTGEVKIEGAFFVESSDYDIGAIRSYLQSENGLDYYNEISKLPKSLYNTAVSYSGPAYDSFNNPLRSIIGKLFRKEPLTQSEIDELTSGTKKIAKMARIFENLKPLPESLYVYRSTQVPYEMREAIVPGYEYVDPAFTSASLRQNVTIGGADRMRVFLPKGSKVMPILEHSNHSGEQEIILPPTSIIKVVEAEERKVDGTNRIFFQGVYTGFAYKSIIEKLKKGLTEAVESRRILLSLQRMIGMSEEKKEEGYDPEGKFGGTYDWNLAALVTKAIKDGDIEVDVPVDPSKED
tara:strand:- start:18 stop:2162 length:2145 start_codon:yes stop_codon:yes gene_type:complete